jgi:hypothetical protein
MKFQNTSEIKAGKAQNYRNGKRTNGMRQDEK